MTQYDDDRYTPPAWLGRAIPTVLIVFFVIPALISFKANVIEPLVGPRRTPDTSDSPRGARPTSVATPPAEQANKDKPSMIGAVTSVFSGPQRVPIKAYIVKSSLEVLYLPLLQVHVAPLADVTDILQREETRIKAEQERLTDEALPELKALATHRANRDSDGEFRVRLKLRDLKNDYMKTTSPQLMFAKLPPPRFTFTTNDKGVVTAELPEGDWAAWATISRAVGRTSEEYCWIISLKDIPKAELTNSNMYLPKWAEVPSWVRESW